MMSCDEAVRRLWAYLEEELDARDAGRVEDHLALCRRCCGEAEFAAALRDVLRCMPIPTIPAEAEARLAGFLETLDKEPS
jgi:anti-sigma factor (TIGR02949 family)